MGTINPQSSTPINNSNTQLSNGHGAPTMSNMSPMGSQPPFMNFPNQLIPLQNNLPGMANFGPMAVMPQGQFPMGFGPQNTMPNMNNGSTFQLQNPFFNMASTANQSQPSGQLFMHNPVNIPQQLHQNNGLPVNANMTSNTNQANPSHPSGQMFMNNSANVPQHLNQNMGVQYGQFPMPLQMQMMNPFNPVQMLNPAQVGPYYIPSCSVPTFGFPNQVGQAMGPPNHAFIPNLQLGQAQTGNIGQHGSPNLQNTINPQMGVAASLQSPMSTQHSQGKSTSFTNLPVQSPQKKESMQHSSFMGSQGNHVGSADNDITKSNWNRSVNQNFRLNSKANMSGCRSQKSQFHQMNKANRQSGGYGKNGGRGHSNDRQGNFTNNAKVQEKRSIALNYTEEEIQQWREARKKNHPSKANTSEKPAEKLINSEALDKEAKLRRMQLKEVLAKQAELGIEVAEIPRHYLSDSENPKHGRRDDRNAPHNTKDRFQNRRNKRGRYDNKRENRFKKKQRWENNNDNSSSNTPPLNIREPSLLEKLLSKEINRDKSHLLQVFRFMVMNSFFKDDSPEKPMNFPIVLVKDGGLESKLVEEESSIIGKDAIEPVNDTFLEDEEDDDEEEEIEVQEKANIVQEERTKEKNSILEEGEEEGEIID